VQIVDIVRLIMNAVTVARTSQERRPRRKVTSDPAIGGGNSAATIFPTALGWMAIAGLDGAVVSIDFGYPSERQAERVLAARLPQITGGSSWTDAPKWLDDVAESLASYAAGEDVDFSDVAIAVEHLTPFARQVVAACRNIPRGTTRTYGELAAECGSTGAARAVGSVMAKNRYPLIVPCHRVVGAGGGLGGYSAPEGLVMKRRLLGMELATVDMKR
jgi:methylated-DNA-[protein]-cysteine S-methyltransferase